MSSREIVDAQVHIWAANTPERPWPNAGWDGKPVEPHRETPLDAAELVRLMDEAGVARAILVPPSWEGDRNDVSLKAAAQWPERFAVMGRFADDAPVSQLGTWRAQPGMVGIRLIFGPASRWVIEGVGHPFWAAAADAGLPLMIAPVSRNDLIKEIADRHPDLRITLDHMGTGLIAAGRDEFEREGEVIALATRPNVAVKLSAVPCHSRLPSRPWTDVAPHMEKLFDAFGPERCFFGSDLSRLPCSYRDLVEFFEQDLPWLRGEDLDLVMGRALRGWLNWAG